MLVIGNKEIIEELKKVEEVFSIKAEDNLTEYLGCKFHMNKNKTEGWFRQPSIIKSLEKKLGKEAMKHRLSLTPGTPRFVGMRITGDQDKLGSKEHATYGSGVGKLLYLMKHSWQDLCNAVRELSKTLDNASPIHSKDMYRIQNMYFHQKGMD